MRYESPRAPSFSRPRAAGCRVGSRNEGTSGIPSPWHLQPTHILVSPRQLVPADGAVAREGLPFGGLEVEVTLAGVDHQVGVLRQGGAGGQGFLFALGGKTDDLHALAAWQQRKLLDG